MAVLWKQNFNIIIFLVCFVQTSHCHTDNKGSKFLNIIDDKKFESKDNIITYNSSELQCLGRCMQYEACHSINFELIDQICEVNFEEINSNEDLKDVVGWRYYEKYKENINTNWMERSNFVYMCSADPLPVTNTIGKLYRGNVVDERFPADSILTWENTSGTGGNCQWIGHQDSQYANRLLLVKFWIKFMKQVPSSDTISFKLYNVHHHRWSEACEPNIWCEIELKIQNPNANGDSYHAILIFDSINHLQTIHVYNFDIIPL